MQAFAPARSTKNGPRGVTPGPVGLMANRVLLLPSGTGVANIPATGTMVLIERQRFDSPKRRATLPREKPPQIAGI
jgi:hypothetical protein